MSQLRTYFLGPFQVTRDDKNVLGFESDKMRALLAYLTVEADRPHSREVLATLLWPDQADSAARQNLRQALYIVRQAVDGGKGSGDNGAPTTPAAHYQPAPGSPVPFLLVTRQTVQFNRASDTWCDVWQFNKLLAACDAHNHQKLANPNRCTECLERLSHATELYRGDFLQGFVVNDSREFEEWALLERETLHRQMMRALGRLADYYEEVGEHEQALQFVTWQLKLEPWREESHRQAMSLLSRTGQRSAALAQYETCRSVLAEELGLEPARETTALYERIRDSETEQQPERLVHPVVAGKSVLPIASTPLIGREAEVTAVVELLLQDDVRLLTLTGPGGVGKTRIAMQATADLQEAFTDGAYFVNLAPITEPGLVPAEIASALGVDEMPNNTLIESLISYLQDKQMLLLLDNFEQIVEAAPLITRLIQATSGVKVLVTSRVALGLRGTHEFSVSPMSLPDRVHLPALERVAGYEAIRLFAARAAAIKPGFEITADNAPAIVEICHRLDGLPLAIELAAARIKVLPPRAMLARLQSRLELIAGRDRDVPTRQQTLRNTIEWSYDLLEEEEKQLFWRMAVFQGGRTLEGIEAVCVGDDGRSTMDDSGSSSIAALQIDVLEGVESLVSKSLIQQKEGFNGEPRFWMLETIQEYAREKLQESGEMEALQREHARYFMKLAEEVQSKSPGAEQQEWFSQMEEAHDNIRAALRWAREDGSLDAAGIGLRTAGILWRFWEWGEHTSEGREQLEGALRAVWNNSGSKSEEHPLAGSPISPEGPQFPPQAGERDQASDLRPYLARALNGAGNLAWLQGDYDAARALHEQSLAIRRELGDRSGIAGSLNNLGLLADNQGDYATARALYEESLDLWRDLGDEGNVAVSLNNLGTVADNQGDYAAARSLYEESLVLFREVGDKWNTPWALTNLGNTAYRERDTGRALKLYRESLTLAQETGDKPRIAVCLVGLAGVANQQEQGEKGAKLLGAGEGLLETMGAAMDFGDQKAYEDARSQLRASLGEEAFERARQEGHAMSLEQVIIYALESYHL